MWVAFEFYFLVLMGVFLQLVAVYAITCLYYDMYVYNLSNIISNNSLKFLILDVIFSYIIVSQKLIQVFPWSRDSRFPVSTKRIKVDITILNLILSKESLLKGYFVLPTEKIFGRSNWSLTITSCLSIKFGLSKCIKSSLETPLFILLLVWLNLPLIEPIKDNFF